MLLDARRVPGDTLPQFMFIVNPPGSGANGRDWLSIPRLRSQYARFYWVIKPNRFNGFVPLLTPLVSVLVSDPISFSPIHPAKS